MGRPEDAVRRPRISRTKICEGACKSSSASRHRNCQTFRSGQRICGLAQTLDRRAHYCVAQSLPKARQGLGESQPKGARVLAPRLNPPHAQKTLQSSVKSPDGLSDPLKLYERCTSAFTSASNHAYGGYSGVVTNFP